MKGLSDSGKFEYSKFDYAYALRSNETNKMRQRYVNSG
jgi:hypothetical protein